MATSSKLCFLITNCPGPFRLVSEWVHMLEKYGNHSKIELTVKPVEGGMELLGHTQKFKMQFEVVLIGATSKYGHHVDEPRNVRLLGRFLIPSGLQFHNIMVAPELNKWQWEVVFNPSHHGNSSVGFVAKLDRPLPEEWTL